MSKRSKAQLERAANAQYEWSGERQRTIVTLSDGGMTKIIVCHIMALGGYLLIARLETLFQAAESHNKAKDEDNSQLKLRIHSIKFSSSFCPRSTN